jgi:hypothetical protein
LWAGLGWCSRASSSRASSPSSSCSFFFAVSRTCYLPQLPAYSGMSWSHLMKIPLTPTQNRYTFPTYTHPTYHKLINK